MQTLFLFDWDNTLLASIFLSNNNCTLTNEVLLADNDKILLKKLESAIYKTLSLAINNGIVYIITNAETGWVELSAEKFVPSVCSLFNKIKIISARSLYEKEFPDDPIKWKVKAFTIHVNNEFSINDVKSKKQVISLGDSIAEKIALIESTKNRTDIISKSFLFAQNPDLIAIIKQLDFFMLYFDKIVKYESPLDEDFTPIINF